MATTKKTTSATATSKAPAKKVETATDTPKPEAGKNDTPPAKPDDAPNPDDKGNGDGVKGTDTPNETADAPTETMIPEGSQVLSADEIQKLKDQSFKDGYSEGFSAALDSSGEQNEPGEEGQDLGDGGQAFASYQGSMYSGYAERLGVITLALRVPENHRKGGMGPLVERLERFFDTLDPDDRQAALVIANTIADVEPTDIASGRYELAIKSGINLLNGVDERASFDTPENEAAAAADRLETLGMPEELEIEGEEETGADVDIDDSNSGSSAAARLRQAI